MFFASNQTPSAIETANRFSELSRQSKEDKIISPIRKHFGAIIDLSIEMNAGSPLVFAKLDGMSEKVPINAISGGMTKVAAILFTFPVYPEGIFLIDEIENGIYYKLLPTLWRSILQLANEYEVQVFASTHSLECIRAAAEVAKDDPSSFSLIRMVREGAGSILRQFAGEDFASAVEDDIEVR